MRRLVLLLALLWASGCRPDPAAELVAEPIGGEPGLLATDGKPFRLADHPDEVKLLFFGYTTCPDVCPMALGRAAAVARELDHRGGAKLAEKLLVVFVSIDPARDTPERLTEYLSFFGVRGVGLRGTEAEVAATAKAYGASYKRIDGRSAAGYLIDHTTYLYLIDREGRVRRLVRSDDSVEQIARWVEVLSTQG
jgi:protein SCO1/2